MEKLNKLPIADDAFERLAEFAQQYVRFARIKMKILEADEQSATIRVVQHKNEQNSYLSQKELIRRVKDLFKDEVPEGYKIHVRALPYRKGED